MMRMLVTTAQTLLIALCLTGTARVALAEAKIPTTAAEHQTLAQQYKDKAAALRAEAKEHREMAEAYKKKSGAGATGQEDAKTAKMLKSLRSMATMADKMADDADKTAEYHAQRAKELGGK